MTEPPIYCDATQAMLKVLEATGMKAKTEVELETVVKAMKSDLGEGSVPAWQEVFAWMSQFHTGAERFNMIRAIISSLPLAKEVRLWAKTLMAASQAGGIHPISWPLCAAGCPSAARNAWIRMYNQVYPRSGEPKIIRLDMIKAVKDEDKDERERSWIIEIKDRAPENLLSSHPVVVRERTPGKITSLGKGWCLRELVVFDMPSLTMLGPDLLVMTNVALYLTPELKGLGPNSRIGGQAWMSTPDFAWGSSRKRSLPGNRSDVAVGWEEGESEWESGENGKIFQSDHLSYPFKFPDSWFCLYNGFLHFE